MEFMEYITENALILIPVLYIKELRKLGSFILQKITPEVRN